MIGFFGGTFDPIHNGHLHAARTAVSVLGLEYVNLVLAARPTHRAPPNATIDQRWAMLELALAGDAVLRPDDREVRRGTASYTIETLEEVRAECGMSASIVWLLGWDAYRQLTTWRRWRELLSLSHLAVMRRPGSDVALDATMTAYTLQHRVDDPADMHRHAAGSILFFMPQMLSISATDIRVRVSRGADVVGLLPSGVWTYITKHHLYGG